MNFVPFHALTNATQGPFEFLKYFDDYYNFVEKPEQVTLFPIFNGTHWVHDLLGARGLNVYEPVGQVIKATFVDFVGPNSQYLHVCSLLIHTFNATLLSYWLRMTIKTDSMVSNMVAAIFWVHPLNIEVVGWLSAQNYLFAMTFSLLLMMLIECELNLLNSFIGVSLYFLAALSKASAITIVPLAVMRLYQLHLLEDNSVMKGSVAKCTFYIMLLLSANLVTIYSVHISNIDSEQQYPETSHIELVIGSILRAAMTIVYFLGKVLFPSDLSAHVQFPRFEDLQSIYHVRSLDFNIDPSAILALFILAGITTFFLTRFRQHLMEAIAWISFVVCWGPTSGILQHGDGSQFGANRYMYFPIFFGLAPLCTSILDRTYKKNPRALFAAFLFFFFGFAYVGNHTALTWRDDKALLQNCLKIDPKDLVCLRYAAEYVGNYENNHALAAEYRRREYDLISSSTRGVSFNDQLYLGHLHLLFREGKAACEIFKKVYARGLPPLGPRRQAENNYMMAKMNVILCLVQEGNHQDAMEELATISGNEQLRHRIKVSVSRTVENLRSYLNPDSPKYKQPFYSEFLH